MSEQQGDKESETAGHKETETAGQGIQYLTLKCSVATLNTVFNVEMQYSNVKYCI